MRRPVQGTTQPGGQASYKPRGRKPRNAPTQFGQSAGLWGLHVRSRTGCVKLAGQSDGAIARIPATDTVSEEFLTRPLARSGVMVAQGKAVRYRRWLTRSRRADGTWEEGWAHAGPPELGGARID
jgi:hypothetical protein